MLIFDEFTRWTCEKCGEAGFDSWHKSMHDGINFHGNYPDVAAWGYECMACGWPAAQCWTVPDAPPRVIYGPDPEGYAYESAALEALEAGPFVGTFMQPSDKRDHDWSGGCQALRPAPPVRAPL